MKKIISTAQAPQAIGPYSQGIMIQGGRCIFTAGQLGLVPDTGDFISRDFKDQAIQALKNIHGILQAADASLKDIVKITVFFKDLNDFATLNEVFSLYFPSDPPARSAIQAARLPKDALLEIEATAFLPGE